MNVKSIGILIDIAYEIRALLDEHLRRFHWATDSKAINEVEEYRSNTEGVIEVLRDLQRRAQYEEQRTDRQHNEIKDFKRNKMMDEWHEFLTIRRNYFISKL